MEKLKRNSTPRTSDKNLQPSRKHSSINQPSNNKYKGENQPIVDPSEQISG